MSAINKTIGLHCKGCDAPLGVNDYDGELCVPCLNAVLELNTQFYKEMDDAEFEKAVATSVTGGV